jgi:basic membrane lipoprotein Med (substrate-binding protein (PBP1-ABC) superfamily)
LAPGGKTAGFSLIKDDEYEDDFDQSTSNRFNQAHKKGKTPEVKASSDEIEDLYEDFQRDEEEDYF